VAAPKDDAFAVSRVHARCGHLVAPRVALIVNLLFMCLVTESIEELGAFSDKDSFVYDHGVFLSN
jgi:hypothetical protein